MCPLRGQSLESRLAAQCRVVRALVVPAAETTALIPEDHEPVLGDCYLEFESGHFPTEGGWIGDDPDPELPAGREIAEFLLSVVDPGVPASEIWNEESYGWAFNCRIGKITVNVLVQFLESWLVIVQPVSLRPRFLRGAAYDEAVLEVCTRIHRGIQTVPRTGRARWSTSNEYERAGR